MNTFWTALSSTSSDKRIVNDGSWVERNPVWVLLGEGEEVSNSALQIFTRTYW